MFFVRMAVFATALAALCAGCTGKRAVEDPGAYVADETNGLRKTTAWHGVTLAATYTPNVLVVHDLLGDRYTPRRGDSLLGVLDDYTYFKLTLSRNGQAITHAFAGDPLRYGEAQEYLSSRIGGDVHMVVGEQLYDLYDHLYVQGNALSKASTVLLVFKGARIRGSHAVKLVFSDRVFGTGTSVFEFEGSSIALFNATTL